MYSFGLILVQVTGDVTCGRGKNKNKYGCKHVCQLLNRDQKYNFRTNTICEIIGTPFVLLISLNQWTNDNDQWAKRPQDHLECYEVAYASYMFCPESQILISFAPRQAGLELHWMNLNTTEHYEVKGTPFLYPNFNLFRSMINSFRGTCHFWNKCPEWPQMTFKHWNVKCTPYMFY